MSGPTFTSPSAEVAEMNRIHYELEYTEGISQRMRIPETLMVAPEKQTGALPLQQSLPIHTTMMQVPERIVVAGEVSKDFLNYLLLIPTAIDLFVPLSSLPPQVTMGTLCFPVPETWT